MKKKIFAPQTQPTPPPTLRSTPKPIALILSPEGKEQWILNLKGRISNLFCNYLNVSKCCIGKYLNLLMPSALQKNKNSLARPRFLK